MFNKGQTLIGRIISGLSQLFLLAIFVRTLMNFSAVTNLSGALLMQLFIGLLIFLRIRRKNTLFFLPDEMLVALPYFWCISLLGPVDNWLSGWLLPMCLAFALSMLQVLDGQHGFAGGLKKNGLLQAVAASVVFILGMLIFLINIFPVFELELYRRVILQVFVTGAGLPVSLSAFYSMVAGKRSIEESLA